MHNPGSQNIVNSNVNQSRYPGLWDLGFTPINVTALDSLLCHYPDKIVADQLSHGLNLVFLSTI